MANNESNQKRSLISNRDSKDCPSRCQEAFQINTWLLKYKAYFVLLYGAVHSVFPYLALHYKQLGMSVTQIGLTQGMLPFICFVSAPSLGYLGDKFRIHKLILICSTFIWMGVFLAIALLPPPTRSEICPAVLNTTVTNMTEEEMSKLMAKYSTDISWTYDADSVNRTFYIIITCMFIGGMLWAPVGTLSDVALLYDLQEQYQTHKFGTQRAFGSVGRTIFNFVTGAVIQSTVTVTAVCGVTLTFGDYRWAYFIFIMCMSGALVISFTFNFKYEDVQTGCNEATESNESKVGDSPDLAHSDEGKETSTEKKESDFKIFCKLLCVAEYTAWLITSFFLGYYNGTTTGFLNWYLELLGGSSLLMGLAGGISSFTQFVFFYITPYAVRKFGRQILHYFVLLCIVARYANYAFLYNPWLILVSQVLEGAIDPIAWVAIVDLTESKLDRSAKGISMGVLHGIFKGLGPGLGFILGGVSFKMIGPRTTFMMLTVCSSVWCVVLFIIQLVENRGDYQAVFKMPKVHERVQ